MNDQDIERLLHQTAPAEAPFGARAPKPASLPGAPSVGGGGPRLLPLAAAAVFVAFSAWVAGRAQNLGPARVSEIDALVAQLDDPAPERRADAERRVLERGAAVLPAVDKAARRGRAGAQRMLPWLTGMVPISPGRVFFVRFGVYERVSAASIPDWMQPVLATDRPYLVIVQERDGRIDTTAVRLHLHATRNEVLPEINLIWDRDEQTGHFLREPPVMLPRHDLRDIFVAWPRLRDSSFAFMAKDARSLFEGLTSSSTHGPAHVRAAAAHALRHFFTFRSVEAALSALEDEDPAVRAVARDTLSVLIDPPSGAAAAEWWHAAAERGPILQRRFDERLKEIRKP